jgi:hypothetical protein
MSGTRHYVPIRALRTTVLFDFQQRQFHHWLHWSKDRLRDTRTRKTSRALPSHYMETNMGQLAYDQWVTVENIAKFEQQIKSKTDTCQRKLLEGLLVLEREKLKTIYASER